MESPKASAQSSLAGTVMQAQTENDIVIPAEQYYWDFNRVVTRLPGDPSSTFYYDARAIAYASAGSEPTTCQVGLSADIPPDHRPLIMSPVIDVPANTTVAIPLEYVSRAVGGEQLTLSMQLISGPTALKIEQWTSLTAEVAPSE